MYERIRSRVDRWVAEHGEGRYETDRVVVFDVTNRDIDGYCYLLGGRERFPQLVAKAARTAAGREVFEIEFRTLERLERIGMNADRPTVPAALARWDEDGLLITLQTALGGTLMKNVPGSELFSPGRAGDSLARVTDWWCEFQQRSGTVPVTLDGADLDRCVTRPARRFRARYRVRPDEDALLVERFERNPRLRGIELPFMARHGDFVAANMVVGEAGIGVFDWEFPLTHEPPLFDLFFFFASLRYPHGGYRGESSHFRSFVEVYWGQNYFSEAVRGQLRRAAAEFGVPREALGDLLLLSVIEVANMKYEALEVSHGLTEETPEPERVDDEDKKRRWSRFRDADKDAPFARIVDGRLENLAVFARQGVPDVGRV